MKKLLILFLFPFMLHAETGRIYLTLTAALKMSEVKSLSFGNITSSGDALITVSPTGVRTITGEATAVESTASEGGFQVTGAPNSPFVVTFGTGSATNGKSTIVVDGFKTNLQFNTGTTDGTGKLVFYVGATAHLSVTNSSGSYVGNYEVNCLYQ
jgi:hypothetical protein